MEQRRVNNGRVILQLWFNWMLSNGALTLLVILSLWVKPAAMPLIAFAMMLFLYSRIRRNHRSHIPNCYVLPFVATRTLFWTAIVMLTVNLIYSDLLIHHFFTPSEVNRDIPFIVILIVSPVATGICGWTYFHRHDISFCRDCRLRYGTPAERGFLGIIYTQEGHYQIGLLTVLSVVMMVLGWGYYLLLYVNSSFILPDRFVFIWVPALMWVASSLYLGLRYLGVYGYYCKNIAVNTRRGQTTRVRYIMIWDNFICLRKPEQDIDREIFPDTKFDTPVSGYIQYREHVSPFEATQYFENFSDLRGVDVRFMFSNDIGNADCNIFHYLVFLTDEQKAEFSAAHPDCDWYSMPEVADMINNRMVNSMFSAEITRLHTIAMAWKTYDHEGRRRYRIKHYRPTFNVRDIHNWDVDYNDPTWLYISDNNQDVPFFRLRRFWRRYINGVGHFPDTRQ